MIRLLFLLAICMFTAFSAQARPVIADLSLRQIEIDSGFKGTEILLFGARNEAGDVVVVVRGPQLDYVMRKKERIAGVWANNQKVTFRHANGFYTAAASRPLDQIRNDYLLHMLAIGMDNMDFTAFGEKDEDLRQFKEAFLEKQEKDQLYLPKISDVSFIGDTLFRTIIRFPEKIPRGVYTAEVYLFSDGQLLGVQSTPLVVRKKGFDALVFDFSRNYPFTYGVIAVLIALGAGWAAGVIFRKV